MSIGLPAQGNSLESPPSPNQTGILIVDEDPAFQLGLKTFLREYVGFEKVYTAANGNDAIDLIQADSSIEILTLDYQMPGLSGIEVLQELQRVVTRPLIVLMVTGYPSDELESEFMSFKSPTLLTSKFLSKPVEFEMLEPLLLKAHEELLSAKHALDAPSADEPRFFETIPEFESIPKPNAEPQLLELRAAAAASEARLNELEAKLNAMKKSGSARLWIGLTIAGLIWLAAQLGFFEQFAPGWDRLKETVREQITSAVAHEGGSQLPSDQI